MKSSKVQPVAALELFLFSKKRSIDNIKVLVRNERFEDGISLGER